LICFHSDENTPKISINLKTPAIMNALQFQQKLLSMQDNMMNFALMLTANRDDAQDLLQDTTLKVLNNQDKFVDNVNFKGWVLTVMRNIFINNYHKVVRSHMVIEQNTDLYNLEVLNESGFDSPDGSWQIQEITKIINKLNNELKVPFSMYVSGYKYREIAEKLDKPLGTIKSRIFFARQELQRKLKDFHKE
jgi:RNA polymerase sigma-70 factor (ECF subfamily)